MSAELFAWLGSLRCNSLHLGRDDDHACNYMSAKEWIEHCGHNQEREFENVPADELQRMKETNTIWSLQVYPDTPIGSYKFYGESMESVIRHAMESGVCGAWDDPTASRAPARVLPEVKA